MVRNTLFTIGSIIISNGLAVSAAEARVGESQTLSDYRHAHEFISEQLRSNSPGKVLIVYDIDNTILTPKGDLGGEHWFNWQKSLLESDPESPLLVGRSVAEILSRQEWLMLIGGVVPTDPMIPDAIASYVKQGAQVMALTSRRTTTRDVTQMHFAANRIDFRQAAPTHPMAGKFFLPYETQNPRKFGLEPSDLELTNGSVPRPVVYDQGVLLTDGQHKGVMLKSFLHSTSRKPQVVIFVDDRAHHHEGMQKAFLRSSVVTHSIRLVTMQPKIEAFEHGTKAESIQQWIEFQRGICLSMPHSLLGLCH